MLKKIILGIIVFTVAAFALVLLVGYLYQNNNTKFSSQEISQNGPKDIPLMSVNMTSTEDCFKDEDCYFYIFSILASEDGDTIVYDKEGASPDPDNIGFWTSVSFNSVDGEINDKKRVYAVNAKTPTECIYDKECVWYAFYNLVNRSAMGKKSKNTLSKWETNIDYAILPTDIPGYSEYRSEIENIFEKIEPYFPYGISFNKQFNYLLFFSSDLKKDVTTNYSNFFNQVSQGTNLIKESVLHYDDLESYECINLPYKDAEKKYFWAISFVNPNNTKACLAHSILYSLGLASTLRNFPFSVMNETFSQEKKLTSLDMFLIMLLYEQNFELGLQTNYKKIKEIFETTYLPTIEKYEQLKE